jgi:hypothetical protein
VRVSMEDLRSNGFHFFEVSYIFWG